MDDEESDDIDRIARELGIQFPDLENDEPDDEAPSLDDLDESDLERRPRDWRKHWERGHWEYDE